MIGTKKIKVLVVDDSVFMRQMISDILGEDSDIEVVGQSSNAKDGIQKIKELSPDVVTLDYQMPGFDGIAALKIIMKECPTAVVMISAYTREGGKIALEALREGAIDYVLKPSGEISLDITTIKKEITEKIKTAAGASFRALQESLSREVKKISFLPHAAAETHLIAIGSSTGGTRGIELILGSLPAEFPSPILIVQHMPEMFTALFAERLNRISKITVKEGKDGEEIRKGVAYIAPGGWHMKIKKVISNQQPVTGKELPVIDYQLRITLTKDSPVHGLRPSVDVLMSSVAKVCGRNSIGIILSGMGRDGVDGMGEIFATGGATIAQDEATSVIFGMPREAIAEGVVGHILPIDGIAGKIVELIS